MKLALALVLVALLAGCANLGSDDQYIFYRSWVHPEVPATPQ